MNWTSRCLMTLDDESGLVYVVDQESREEWESEAQGDGRIAYSSWQERECVGRGVR